MPGYFDPEPDWVLTQAWVYPAESGDTQGETPAAEDTDNYQQILALTHQKNKNLVEYLPEPWLTQPRSDTSKIWLLRPWQGLDPG